MNTEEQKQIKFIVYCFYTINKIYNKWNVEDDVFIPE